MRKRAIWNIALRWKKNQISKRLRQLNIVDDSKTPQLPKKFNKSEGINNNFLHFSGISCSVDQNFIHFYRNNFKNAFSETFSVSKFDIDEVGEHLLAIDSLAVGPDLINLQMLKLCCTCIYHIINSYIVENVFFFLNFIQKNYYRLQWFASSENFSKNLLKNK